MKQHHCLLLDVRVDVAFLAIISSDETSLPYLLTDIGGRVRQPLTTSWLWTDNSPIDERISRIHRFLEYGEDDDDARHALTSLFAGAKRYAESRVEHGLTDLCVIISNNSARPGVLACGTRAGFNTTGTLRRPVTAMAAYGLFDEKQEEIRHSVVVDMSDDQVSVSIVELEDGISEVLGTSKTAIRAASDESSCLKIREAIHTALRETEIEWDQIRNLVLCGSHDKDDEDGRACLFQFFEDTFSKATIYGSIALDQVCVHGGMHIMQARFKPIDLDTICCMAFLSPFTIGIEAFQGLMTPILLRNMCLPMTQTTHVRVYTPATRSSVTLRFFEGEATFARDNIELATVVVRNLAIGWNDLSIRVDVTRDYVATIDVCIGNEWTRPLREVSNWRGMTPEEYSTALDAQQSAAEAENYRRRSLQARECMESLVTSALILLDREVPVELCRPFELMPQFLSIETGDVDLDLRERLTECIDTVNWAAVSPTQEQELHDQLLDLLDDKITWYRQWGEKCTYCCQRTERFATVNHE